MADNNTATTDASTMPCNWIEPNFIDNPDSPAINIVDVRIRFIDFE